MNYPCASLAIVLLVLSSCSAGQTDQRFSPKGELEGSCAYDDPHMCQEFWGAGDGPSTCTKLGGKWAANRPCATLNAIGKCERGQYTMITYKDAKIAASGRENVERSCEGRFTPLGQ